MALPLEQNAHYTYADLLSWDDTVRYELYGGQPVALASPTDVHQRISIALSAQLYALSRDRQCQAFAAPFDVRLFEQEGDAPEDVDTVVQPDLMIVCDKSKIDRRGVHGAPDLVVEILSDSTRRNDQLVKYRMYQKAGVREYWVVDPMTRVLLVHTLEDGQYSSPHAYGPAASVPLTIAEEAAVDLSQVFPAEA